MRLKTLAAELERGTELAGVAGPMSELFLDWVGRIQNWSDELEEATGGRLLSDGAGQVDLKRADMILVMSERLLRMMDTSMGCLMDARGGKEVFVMQMAARASNPYQAEPGEPRQREIAGRAIEILMERSRIYGLPAPEVVQEAERQIEDERQARRDRKAKRNGPPRTSSSEDGQ